ncbi:MAG: 50S ribosomal protein L33 [Candidatus Paceibacterota bacterium]|jgi:large subunit ribosomal protein L33|nr:50S ribosomal protein L33 [Candidatus Paceibacterota bacterium]
MAKRKAYTKLQCQECKQINYNSHKSKNLEEKLELKKFCRFCKKHTPHKETKK